MRRVVPLLPVYASLPWWYLPTHHVPHHVPTMYPTMLPQVHPTMLHTVIPHLDAAGAPTQTVVTAREAQEGRFPWVGEREEAPAPKSVSLPMLKTRGCSALPGENG